MLSGNKEEAKLRLQKSRDILEMENDVQNVLLPIIDKQLAELK